MYGLSWSVVAVMSSMLSLLLSVVREVFVVAVDPVVQEAFFWGGN